MIWVVVRKAFSTFRAVFAEVSKNIRLFFLANAWPSSKETSLLCWLITSLITQSPNRPCCQRVLSSSSCRRSPSSPRAIWPNFQTRISWSRHKPRERQWSLGSNSWWSTWRTPARLCPRFGAWCFSLTMTQSSIRIRLRSSNREKPWTSCPWIAGANKTSQRLYLITLSKLTRITDNDELKYIGVGRKRHFSNIYIIEYKLLLNF